MASSFALSDVLGFLIALFSRLQRHCDHSVRKGLIRFETANDLIGALEKRSFDRTSFEVLVQGVLSMLSSFFGHVGVIDGTKP